MWNFLRLVPNLKLLVLKHFVILLKKVRGINNVYYSRFNSTILFECGIKDKIYMFHIDGCTNFEVFFLDK